ncbi:MAG TPA: hypothetical protein H9894_09215 [Candidatus Desulfovibrio intestinipullorum]|uniref:Uncharacterized protein n=1 Tax=Candidatus Desulfovibrio intestinipullorum TaxID=2838536 RepID=A0A9D1PX32_9BACT|nr:hypothetical protein [Candidatus Desulfovibrio intestinipullorum]
MPGQTESARPSSGRAGEEGPLQDASTWTGYGKRQEEGQRYKGKAQLFTEKTSFVFCTCSKFPDFSGFLMPEKKAAQQTSPLLRFIVIVGINIHVQYTMKSHAE